MPPAQLSSQASITSLLDVAPDMTRVGYLFSPATNPLSVTSFEEQAIRFGLEPVQMEVNDADEYRDAITAFANRPNSGLAVNGAAELWARTGTQ